MNRVCLIRVNLQGEVRPKDLSKLPETFNILVNIVAALDCEAGIVVLGSSWEASRNLIEIMTAVLRAFVLSLLRWVCRELCQHACFYC